MKKTVIIHGHFYQPPRANPWTGIVERQPTAAPADNWNQRILHECYLPNTRARIKNHGEEGERTEEINNFEMISFNLGPTLAGWLALNYTDVYFNIINSDKKSRNAIAQSYNHTILPLDSPFIRRVQIKWGIEDFKMRYGRSPAAMWLPECAVSYAAAEDLVKAGMKFMVLTQGQAAAVRKIGEETWKKVARDSLDTTRVYRMFTNSGPIDVFFSNHKLSMDISFHKILDDPSECARRIEETFCGEGDEDRLLTLITDGESFGHHHRGGEKGLGSLLKHELPSRGIEVSTFEEYLKNHTPQWEVKIKDPSSWSCAHGVGRWKSACGCGRQKGNDLKWRRPLRNSLNWLAGKAVELFRENARDYFKTSPREAIFAFGEVLSNSSKMKYFRRRHVVQSMENSDKAGKAMELIHSSFYMLTSCGWFFGSFSRPEPVQNLAYALKSLQFLKELWGVDLDDEFFRRLNTHPESGRVWNELVKPLSVSPRGLSRRFMDIYNITGTDMMRIGDWNIMLTDREKRTVRMSHCRSGEVIDV